MSEETLTGFLLTDTRTLEAVKEERDRLRAFVERVIEDFDCDCEELRGETGDPVAICFWCMAKEAAK